MHDPSLGRRVPEHPPLRSPRARRRVCTKRGRNRESSIAKPVSSRLCRQRTTRDGLFSGSRCLSQTVKRRAVLIRLGFPFRLALQRAGRCLYTIVPVIRRRHTVRHHQMYRISTSIDIEAPANRVWAVLMDFPAYSDWNPFVRSLVGNTATGSRLQVTVQPEGGRVMSFAPKVLACVPEQEFRWRGTMRAGTPAGYQSCAQGARRGV